MQFLSGFVQNGVKYRPEGRNVQISVAPKVKVIPESIQASKFYLFFLNTSHFKMVENHP